MIDTGENPRSPAQARCHSPDRSSQERPLVASHRQAPCGAAAREDLEELAGADVDDRCRPRLDVPRAEAGEEHFVEAEGVDEADAGGVVDKRCAVGEDGVVDSVPVAAELLGEVGHRAAASANLLGHPPPGPVRHHQPGRSDRRGGLGERLRRTAAGRAGSAALVTLDAGLHNMRSTIRGPGQGLD
jgi:hypothetical protein